MRTGKRFKLANPTLALDIIDGKRVAVTVPAGAIISVVSGPMTEGDRLIDALWAGRTVAMFSYEVVVRGIEIKEPGSEPPESRRSASAL